MNNDDIAEFFERISERMQGADDGTQRMCRMLVDTALRYRDLLRHSEGATLTVQETSHALDAFMQVLQTQDIPEGLPPHVHALLLMWLEDLRKNVHH